jgi:hypothetical protein
MPKRDCTLQGLKASHAQYAKHHHRVKPTITSKVCNTLVLPYALIAIEIRFLDGMAKNGRGRLLKWIR